MIDLRVDRLIEGVQTQKRDTSYLAAYGLDMDQHVTSATIRVCADSANTCRYTLVRGLTNPTPRSMLRTRREEHILFQPKWQQGRHILQSADGRTIPVHTRPHWVGHPSMRFAVIINDKFDTGYAAAAIQAVKLTGRTSDCASIFRHLHHHHLYLNDLPYSPVTNTPPAPPPVPSVPPMPQPPPPPPGGEFGVTGCNEIKYGQVRHLSFFQSRPS